MCAIDAWAERICVEDSSIDSEKWSEHDVQHESGASEVCVCDFARRRFFFGKVWRLDNLEKYE